MNATETYPPGATSHNGVHDTPPAASGLVRLWEQSEPKPREFFIEGLVPKGCVTSLYGEGGVFKSLIAAYMGICLTTDRDFGGRATLKVPVLYVDFELDQDEALRRVYSLGRGMDPPLDRPPQGFHYYRLEGPLTDDTARAKLRLVVAEAKAQVCFLDSITMSMYGGDPKEASDVIAIIKMLEGVGTGTWIAVDHVPKGQPGMNKSHATAFGSVFKNNCVRSALQVTRADGGGIKMAHTKANFSALAAPLFVALNFEAGDDKKQKVVVKFTDPGDESMAGIEKHSSAVDQTYLALCKLGVGKWDKEAIQKSLEEMGIEMKIGTISNNLTALKEHERVTQPTYGYWMALLDHKPDQAPDPTVEPEPETEEVADIPF